MSSASAIDSADAAENRPQFLRSGGNLTRIRFTAEENPFNNRNPSTGEDIIELRARHLVFQIPTIYFAPHATSFQNINTSIAGFSMAAINYLKLLKFLLDVYELSWGHSQGIMDENKRSKRQKYQASDDMNVNNLINSALGRSVDGMDEEKKDDGDDGEAKEENNEEQKNGQRSLPPETAAYPLTSCIEIVRGGGDPINGPVVAIRVHFFINSTRSNFEDIMCKAFMNNGVPLSTLLDDRPRKTKLMMMNTVDTLQSDKFTFKNYIEILSAYTGTQLGGAFVRNQPNAFHQVKNTNSAFNPFKALSMETAMNMVMGLGGHGIFAMASSYRDDNENRYSFPVPQNVYFMNNDFMKANIFFRLVWPHKSTSIIELQDDPQVLANAALHLGCDVEEKTKHLGGDIEEAKRIAPILQACSMAVKEQSFSKEHELGEFMDRRLVELKISFNDKIAEETSKCAPEPLPNAVYTRYYNKYCRLVHDARVKGLGIFDNCIWNEMSNISDAKKLIVGWMNNHLAKSQTSSSSASASVSTPAINFSIPIPKQTINLSRGSELFWHYISPLETMCNIIQLHSTIVRAYVSFLHVYSPHPLHPNMLLTSEPGVGKSFCGSVLRKLVIQDTLRSLDMMTAKSLLGVGVGKLQNMGFVMEELPGAKVGNFNSKGGAASNEGSSGEDFEAIFKKILSEGVLYYRRSVYNENTREWESKEIKSEVSTWWLIFTNDGVRKLFSAWLNRLYFEHVVGNPAISAEEQTMRLAMERVGSGNKDLDNSYNLLKAMFRRDQAMVAMMYSLIDCSILPQVNREAGAVFLAAVLSRINNSCLGTTEKRNVDRVIQIAEVATLLYAVNMTLDSELSVCKDKPWKSEHILGAIPYMVIGMEQMCFAIGACSGQYENDVLRMIVNVVCDSFLSKRQPSPMALLPPDRQVAANSQQPIHIDVGFNEQMEQARRIAEEKRREQEIKTSNEQARWTGVAGGKNKQNTASSSSSTQMRLGSALSDAAAKTQAAASGTALASYMPGSGSRQQHVDDSHPVYLSIKIPELELKECTKRFRRERWFDNNHENQDDGGNKSASHASSSSKGFDVHTEQVQLEALSNLIFKSSGARGCSELDIFDNLKTLAYTMRVKSPDETDDTRYPALAIDAVGRLYLAKSIEVAHTGKSVLVKAIQKVLQMTIDYRFHAIYGKSRPLQPHIWQLVHAYPVNWRGMDVIQRKEFMKDLIMVRNTLHRSEVDVTVSQAVVDAVSTFQNKKKVDLSKVFDKEPGYVCTPGSLMVIALVRHLNDGAISQEWLNEYGHDKIPSPREINRRILSIRYEELKKTKLVYPYMYEEVRNPTITKDRLQGIKAKMDLKKTAGAIALEQAHMCGFNMGDINTGLECIPANTEPYEVRDLERNVEQNVSDDEDEGDEKGNSNEKKDESDEFEFDDEEEEKVAAHQDENNQMQEDTGEDDEKSDESLLGGEDDDEYEHMDMHSVHEAANAIIEEQIE